MRVSVHVQIPGKSVRTNVLPLSFVCEGMHGVFKLRDLSFKVLLYSIPVCVCVRIRVRSLEFVCVRLATIVTMLSSIS